MRVACYVLGCLLTLVLPGGDARATEKVRVEVIERETRQPLKGARVVILGQGGGVIAEATTDELGQAFLPRPRDSDRPLYVLAEPRGCFVTGLRWLKGQEEYYLLAGVLAVK